jgi:hypothetical protein
VDIYLLGKCVHVELLCPILFILILQEVKPCKVDDVLLSLLERDLRRTGKPDGRSSSSQWRVRKNGLLESVLVVYSGESGGMTLQTTGSEAEKTRSGDGTAGLQSDDLVPLL